MQADDVPFLNLGHFQNVFILFSSEMRLGKRAMHSMICYKNTTSAMFIFVKVRKEERIKQNQGIAI